MQQYIVIDYLKNLGGKIRECCTGIRIDGISLEFLVVNDRLQSFVAFLGHGAVREWNASLFQALLICEQVEKRGSGK